jgi:hypothetical protein
LLALLCSCGPWNVSSELEIKKSVQCDQQRNADDKYNDWNQEMKISEYGFSSGSESTVLSVGLRQETISSGSRASVSVSFFRIAAQIIAQVSSHILVSCGEEYTVRFSFRRIYAAT